MSDYWQECVEESFEDAGITATKEQIDTVTGWVESAHDNYGMAHGHDAIPNPLYSVVDQLKKEIADLMQMHEKQLYGVKKGVANRLNVETSDVHIDERGHVTYDQ